MTVRRWALAALCALSVVLLVTATMSVSGTGGPRSRNLVYRPSRAEQPLPAGLRFAVAANRADDPRGDTLLTGETDIRSLSAFTSNGVLVITVGFFGPIDPPDSLRPNAINGFIDIDADQNGNTGDLPWTDELTGSDETGMGNEFYVDLFRFDPEDGAVDLVDDPNEVVVARVPFRMNATSFSVHIPLSVLGDEGNVNVAAVLGPVSAAQPADDKAPNNGSVASSVGAVPGQPCTLIDTRNTQACIPGLNPLCLTDGRFEVTASWATTQMTSGEGFAVPLTDDTGYFWFFEPDNVEMVVKVLNACSIVDRFWVFAGGLTDVEVEWVVRDTVSGLAQVCENPQVTPFQPIQETNGFATCP